MQRRTFITTVAASLGTTTLAGCVAGGPSDDSTAGGTDNATDQPSSTPTDSAPKMTGQSLERREKCSESGSASISAESNVVTVEGCITGKDGCQVPVLEDATYDAGADELTVTVTTENGGSGDACTQQIVELGYTATVEFEGGLPKTTTVVHHGATDDGQVAQAETRAN